MNLTILAYRGNDLCDETAIPCANGQSKSGYAEIAAGIRSKLDYSRVILIDDLNEVVADTNGMGS
jgi:hypothetical protein